MAGCSNFTNLLLVLLLLHDALQKLVCIYENGQARFVYDPNVLVARPSLTMSFLF